MEADLMDRKSLRKQLREAATPEILDAARSAYSRYRSICSRYPEVEVEKFTVFLNEWLELRHFDRENEAAARPVESDDANKRDYRRQFDGLDMI